MKKIFLLGILFFAYIFSASSTFACSCMMPEDATTEMNSSKSVFVGEVKSLSEKGYSKFVTLDVLESFKGNLGDSVEVKTGSNSAACGYNFEKGKKYLVYTNKSDETISVVSLCSRTNLLENSIDDLVELSEKKDSYKSQEIFELSEGKTCESATDGVNTFFMKDGKVSGGTLIGYPEGYVEKWSCIKKINTNDADDMKVCTMQYEPVCGVDGETYSNSCTAGDVKIAHKGECGEGATDTDDTKICTMQYEPVCGVDGKTYSNPCMAGDVKIAYKGKCEKDSKDTDDIKVCTMQYEPVCGVDGKTYGNSCTAGDTKIAHKGECFSDKIMMKHFSNLQLSDADKDFLRSIIFKLGKKYTNSLLKAFSKYESKIEKISNLEKKEALNNKVLERIKKYKNNLLSKFPQGVPVSKKQNMLWMSLEVIQFKLQDIDIVLREAKCKKDGDKWTSDGMLGNMTCIKEYSDAGKKCKKSSECQGDCIVTYADSPATCAKNNSIFGCKVTVEKYNAGEGIMCVD